LEISVSSIIMLNDITGTDIYCLVVGDLIGYYFGFYLEEKSNIAILYLCIFIFVLIKKREKLPYI
jgi:hypothetical protein